MSLLSSTYRVFIKFLLGHRGWGLTFALFFLLTLTYPSEKGSGLAYIDEQKARSIHETYKVYSVLESQDTGLADALKWDTAETIREESRKHSLDPMLILAVIKVESSFRPNAVSSTGARGLMQIRPPVAEALARQAALERWEGKKSLDNPVTNIKLGVSYLGHLKERFKDLKIALTAYKWGPTEVKNRLEKERAVPLEYARKVLSVSRAYREQSGQARVVPLNQRRKTRSYTIENLSS